MRRELWKRRIGWIVIPQILAALHLHGDEAMRRWSRRGLEEAKAFERWCLSNDPVRV